MTEATCAPRPRWARRVARALALGASLALLAGCAVTPVAPWQKEFLADPRMALDPDRLDSRYTEHIYFSREGSSGGSGIGGGGCGCN